MKTNFAFTRATQEALLKIFVELVKEVEKYHQFPLKDTCAAGNASHDEELRALQSAWACAVGVMDLAQHEKQICACDIRRLTPEYHNKSACNFYEEELAPLESDTEENLEVLRIAAQEAIDCLTTNFEGRTFLGDGITARIYASDKQLVAIKTLRAILSACESNDIFYGDDDDYQT